ncbi:MAG TPA: acyltransferase domain-containing protein, partial [Planctomycetota bacterium]|nr:acyltransferase domain-containing protein [Planctomycetota bacterium]
MNLDTLLSELGLEAVLCEVLAPHWEESVASLPTGGLERLDPAVFLADRAYVGLGGDVDEALIATAQAIGARPALKLLFWHFVQSVYAYPRGVNSAKWPDLDVPLDGRGGVFYLLAGLAMVPRTRAVHAMHKIPEAITRDTVQQVRCFCDEMYRRGHDGKPGIFQSQAYWFRNYTDGWLYRLGRMEYMLRPFGNVVEVFRNRETKRTVALACAGLMVDAQGQLLSAEDAAKDASAWQTVRADTQDSAVGAPVSPRGFVERREVRLPLNVWERVLGP